MANHLEMEQQQAIQALARKGWSLRRITRELGVNRRTARRYAVDSKCTIAQTGNPGRKSQCEPFREEISNGLERGLSIERIHRDLVEGHGFGGSYYSIRRFALKLEETGLKRVYRIECEPGQEAQIDYGTMRLPVGDGGRMKKVHFLLVTLSCSRKSYVEGRLRQDAESFLRSLENAFRHFGGVPERLCPDNLKAAVEKADWYEPELNPKLRSFADHYGTLVMPARPRTPTDKGKVEAGVKYVKNNALKGRSFSSLAEVNEHLRWWLEHVADKRIHGTTKRQVGVHFEQAEKPVLKPLPANLFPSFSEGRRSVHRDSYIEVAGAYYEVPAQYIGRQVWVRWDAAMVRIFSQKMKPLSSHRRLEKGRFSHPLGVGGTRGGAAHSTGYYRRKAAAIGGHAAHWADALIENEGPAALRRLQGLLALRKKYPDARLDHAARKARIHGQYSLRALRQWLESPHEQETFSFLQQHELIRNTQTYDAVADTAGLFD